MTVLQALQADQNKTVKEIILEKELLSEIYNTKSLSEWLKNEIKGGK